MRNLARINNYYNNIECAAEFESLCEEAKQLGVETPILPDKIGWRKLDKINIKLRERIAIVKLTGKLPAAEPSGERSE